MSNGANVIPLGSREAGGKVAPEKSESNDLYQGVLCEVPPCPQWLSKEARAHWKFVTAELKKAGTIARLDQGALAILCTAYAGMRKAQEQMARVSGDKDTLCGGEFQKTPNAYVQLSAYAVSYDRHSAKYEKLAKQFGLTVRAREQIKFKDPNQGDLEL